MKKTDQQEEKKEEKEVRFMDILTLQRSLEPYKQLRMQGMLVSRVNQWLVSCNVVAIVNGELRIIDAQSFKWWAQVEQELQRYEASKNPQKIDLRSIRPAGLVKAMPIWVESEEEKLRAEALEAIA